MPSRKPSKGAAPKPLKSGSQDHIDVAPGPHIDTQIPPPTNTNRHIDTPAGPHIDAGGMHVDATIPPPGPHIDTTMPHADSAMPPHVDATQHIDAPGGPHADTPVTPHIDISIPLPNAG
jgi:hypothetical protein